MKTTVTVVIDNGASETTIDVVGDYYAGSPGKTYGEPEDCYPPEPAEFDISDAWLIVPRGRVSLSDMPGGMVNEKFWDRLQELALNKLIDDGMEVLGREFEYDDQLEREE